MMSEQECYRRINSLTINYYSHLSDTEHLTNYFKKKNDILLEIQSASISRILEILNEPCGIADLPITQGELLEKNRSDWGPWLFSVFLITITFPLSVPILMLWSSITRGTPNFFKTRGAIYVESLLMLCNQPLSSLNTSEERAYSKIPSSESSMLVSKNTMQTNPIKNSDNSTNLNVNQNDSLIQESVAAFEQISTGICAAGLWIPEEARVAKLLRDETGRPLITSYRINAAPILQPDTFSIDIKCFFRWTGHRKERMTIRFSNAFKLPPNGQGFQSPAVLQPDSEPNAPQSIFNFWSAPPAPEPNCQEALKIAEEMKGMCSNREKAYLKAYQLAKTDIQRIQVLECLITRYSNYYDYLKRFSSYAPGAMKKANHYLTWLPENYQTQSINANRINDNFQSIFKLLQEQRIDEAWARFDAYSDLSFFIQRAFPNLQAMKHQLHAIFRISRHDIYYGLDATGSVWIPELSVILTARNELRRACKLIESYDPEQKEALEQYGIAPLERLMEIGKEAAAMTSYEERQLRREARIAHNHALFAQNIQPTFRILGEDMDADEEPTVADETSFSL